MKKLILTFLFVWGCLILLGHYIALAFGYKFGTTDFGYVVAIASGGGLFVGAMIAGTIHQ